MSIEKVSWTRESQTTVFIQALVLLAIAALYYCFTWSTELAGYGGDNAFYILTAQVFSIYSEADEVARYFASISFFPPLYPLVLSMFGGGESVLLAHLVTTSILLIAMLIMSRWLVQQGLQPGMALAVVVVFASSPGTYMHAASIHSENLYLLMSLVAIFYAGKEKATGSSLLIASIFVGMASITRGAGISLILAFVVYLFINNKNRKLLYSVIAFIPYLSWNLLQEKRSESYFSILSDFYLGNDSATVLSQLKLQLLSFSSGWHSSFTSGAAGQGLLISLGIVCLLCTLIRLYQRKLDGIYVAAYLSMILSWPYPAEMLRLLFPVFPIVLAQLFIIANDNRTLSLGQRNLFVIQPLLVVALLLTVTPNLVLTVERFMTTVEKELEPYTRSSAWYVSSILHARGAISFNNVFKRSLQRSSEFVPAGECIYGIKPSIIALYSNRLSKEPPPANVGDEDFDNALKEMNCGYFYMISDTSPTYNTAFYPYERLKDRVDILEIYGSKITENRPKAMLAKWK